MVVSGAGVTSDNSPGGYYTAAGESFAIQTTPASSPAAGTLNVGFTLYDPQPQQTKFQGITLGGQAVAKTSWKLVTAGFYVGNVFAANTVSTGATDVTSRLYHIGAASADIVKPIFGFYQKNGVIGESALTDAVTISSSLQNNSTSGTRVQDGPIVPVKFNGADTYTGTYAAVPADAMRFAIRPGQYIFSRNNQNVADTTKQVMASIGNINAANNQNIPVGSGYSGSNLVSSGNVNLDATGAFGWGPVGIAGLFVAGAEPKSLALLGDSRLFGTADNISGSSMGGYGQRICSNQLGMSYNPNAIPNWAFVPLANGGENGTDYLAHHVARGPISAYATTSFIQYGTHDLSNGVAYTKQMLLDMCNLQINTYGAKKALITTLQPNLDSTDYFLTIAGQTPADKYDECFEMNDWIRDPLGFIADAFSAYGLLPSQLGYVDVAFWSVVDADGNNTTGPGYWPVPSATAPYVDGTVNDATGLTIFKMRTDLTSLASNQDINCTGYFLTGVNAGITFQVNFSVTVAGSYHQINFAPGLNVAPNLNDTFRLFLSMDGISTLDGVHETSGATCRTANGIFPSVLAQIA